MRERAMPKTEEHEAIEGGAVVPAPSADLLITVSGPPSDGWENWVSLVDTVVSDLTSNFAAVALPGEPGRASPIAPIQTTKIPIYNYPAQQVDAAGIPGLVHNSIYRPLAELASKIGARALLVLAPDPRGTDSSLVRTLADAVLNGGNDLCLPLYAISPMEGLLNRGLFAPLVSALYGRRVRFPLAQDFCISGRFLERLAGLPVAFQSGISWPCSDSGRGPK